MSLVAYAASSDSEESESEDTPSPTLASTAVGSKPMQKKSTTATFSTNGLISDEEDDYVSSEQTTTANSSTGIGFLNLPKPKNVITTTQLSKEITETIAPVLAKLPMPKASEKTELIVEEDDEFLHKKEIAPAEAPKPPPLVVTSRVPVKITIPSMKDFSDVDAELAKAGKKKAVAPGPNTKRSGLLTMLPEAKSEQNFAKAKEQQTTSAPVATATSVQTQKSNPLIPDTVRNRRPAYNTECVDGVQISKAKKSATKQKPQVSLVQCSDSDASDDEPGDFFSLSDELKLPQVNENELSVMVAKRAAKMAETTTKYLEACSAQQAASTQETNHNEEEMRQAQKRYHESQLNEEALQALVGSSSKRRRQQRNNEIEVVDISSSQVMPDREEWMRAALASQTTYQPTGVLVDEEPAVGTRRKHQITYLAHKAKANEAELQAMWSANRQNRRATQSKYGF